MLTFIVPVRHPENAKNWDQLKTRLAQTIRSISNQNSDDWRAVVVANTGAELPPLPQKFSVKSVDFPPNLKHDRTAGEDIEVFRDFFRVDKGRRVRAGMLSAPESTFFMIVDDDDFVSCRLADHAAKHPDDNGWYIDRGYLWSEKSMIAIAIRNLFMLCGTSHIVSAKLYDFAQLTEEHEAGDYMKNMLGSHVSVARALAATGTPLSALPFPGAIYRVGHSGAHSNSAGSIRTFLANGRKILSPLRLLKAAFSLRFVTPKLRKEFFGVS